MEYTVKEVREYVYELLDESSEILEERVEYGDPGASVGILIEALLPRAARDVLLEAPLARIDESQRITPSGPLDRSAGHMAVMELPADFLRLIYFRMSDWEEGVSGVLEYGSLAWQLRRRKGLHGYRMVCPGVSLRRRGTRQLLLICGSGRDSKAEELEYVAEPEVKSGKIDLPPGLFHDVCERVADMVRKIIGNNYRD